ncbi:MAG TPA: hypothetical protein VLQ48_01860 [Chloroflexia bacterium]|nr:hypothetical protein [Chloroflexia bacterium]
MGKLMQTGGLLAMMVIMLSINISSVRASQAINKHEVPLSLCSGFSDVQDTDFFCHFLTVMVNNGDITGYPDGTFRPITGSLEVSSPKY